MNKSDKARLNAAFDTINSELDKAHAANKRRELRNFAIKIGVGVVIAGVLGALSGKINKDDE